MISNKPAIYLILMILALLLFKDVLEHYYEVSTCEQTGRSHKFYRSTFSDKIPKVGNFIVLDGKKYVVKGSMY